jgi:hypothetical protein
MDGVEISPSDLTFRFQLNKQLLGNININNTTDKRVAFKIKTTAPKKYVVRPSSGVTDVRVSASVQVIMQAQKDYPADFANCKDKFMVQIVHLRDGEQLGPDTFNKDVQKDALKEARLRVILQGPAAPPSPVPEASEQGDDTELRDHVRAEATSSPARTAAVAYNDVAAMSKENSALQGRLDRITKERDELRRTLDHVQLQGVKSPSGDTAHKFRVSLIHLILVAVLAFLLGHYTS